MSSVPAPADRLAASRERLRQAMGGPSKPGGSSKRAAGSANAADLARELSWLHKLSSIPGSHILIDAVTAWWAQHPWRVTGMVALDAADAAVRPVAKRHPWALVAGGFVLGGMIGWTRPWRWIVTPALFAGLLPQLASKAVALIPPGAWAELLASLTRHAEQPRACTVPPEGQVS